MQDKRKVASVPPDSWQRLPICARSCQVILITDRLLIKIWLQIAVTLTVSHLHWLILMFLSRIWIDQIF